jgi:hypothetical protein
MRTWTSAILSSMRLLDWKAGLVGPHLKKHTARQCKI